MVFLLDACKSKSFHHSSSSSLESSSLFLILLLLALSLDASFAFRSIVINGGIKTTKSTTTSIITSTSALFVGSTMDDFLNYHDNHQKDIDFLIAKAKQCAYDDNGEVSSCSIDEANILLEGMLNLQSVCCSDVTTTTNTNNNDISICNDQQSAADIVAHLRQKANALGANDDFKSKRLDNASASSTITTTPKLSSMMMMMMDLPFFTTAPSSSSLSWSSSSSFICTMALLASTFWTLLVPQDDIVMRIQWATQSHWEHVLENRQELPIYFLSAAAIYVALGDYNIIRNTFLPKQQQQQQKRQ